MFEKNYLLVLRYIEETVNDPEDAEDIASEVFAVAWRKLDEHEPFGLPWLIRTAMHRVRDFERARGHKEAAVTALARALEEAPDATERLDVIAMQEALARLPARDREIIKLTLWDGFTAGEISQMLRMSEGAIWTRLSRARAQLKKMLR